MIKSQSAVDLWFTILFMCKSRKDYDMKTNIKVVSCFDGSVDATDVFTDIIAERIKGGDNIISFPKNAKNIVAEEHQNDYNEGVASDHHHAPGLCG